MMISLPTEISSNKDLVSYSPILLVEFVDLNYSISTKNYAINYSSGISDGSNTIGTAIFTSATATFLTWNIRPGDIVKLPEDDFTVLSIQSETQLTFTTVSTIGGTSLTWSIDHNYADLIKERSSTTVSTSIPQAVNSIAGIGSFTLQLTDWRGTVRSTIIGSTPDLTDSSVELYLKFDTASTDDAGMMRIFKGEVEQWNVKNDIFSLSIRNREPALPEISSLVKDSFADLASILSDSYQSWQTYRADNEGSGIADDMINPLQFGDFDWDYNQIHWNGKKDQYARAIYLGKTTVGGYYIFYIADHVMNQVPTQTNYNDANYYDPYMFGLVDGTWIKLVPTVDTFYNASDGCYVIVSSFSVSDMYVFVRFEEEYTANQSASWANAADGDSGTYCPVGYGDRLVLKHTGISKIFSEILDQTGSTAYSRYIISLGTIQTPDSRDKIWASFFNSAGTPEVLTKMEITSSDAGSVLVSSLMQIGWPDPDKPTGSDRGIGVYVDNSYDATNCQVRSIVLAVQMNVNSPIRSDFEGNYLDSVKSVFIRSKGMEYSGTWDSRKTSGNVIENPADVLEAIYRDRFSVTNIDTDSFDTVNSVFSSVKVCTTIYKQMLGFNFVEKFCSAFNLSAVYDGSRRWRIVIPIASGNNFSSSGTGTPGNQDIFTDVDSIINEEFQQHPITKFSFNISRSTADEKFGKITIQYKDQLGELTGEATSGTGREKKIENPYIGDASSANSFLNQIKNWYLTQKNIATFATFYNGISHESGDIINIRHYDLSDDMLDATINTQKWMILSAKITWKPNQIMLTAIELF